MISNRRRFLAATGAMTGSIGSLLRPVLGRSRTAKVSQDELGSAIEQHAIWLEDHRRGKRAVFADRDLSGLDFLCEQDELVNLQGSDFTGADLTGVTGNNVSFLRSSLHGANLSWSHLKRPTFSYASLRSAICEGAIWGWDDRHMSNPARPGPLEGAAFQHTDAGGGANFERAALRGLFVEANFSGANLTEANFSYSLFYGVGHYETSFFAAELARAKFNFADIKAVRFWKATLTEVDFANADIDDRVKLPQGPYAISNLPAESDFGS
jgi:uncharacterized protein YjbI with pentapeptide repeats